MPRPLVFLILALPIAAAYGMYATGIVVIYQASRVLNLAHGAMAAVPAFLVYSLVSAAHVPVGIAFLLGIGSGALIGIVVERIFVRRLRDVSATAQTVGTVAAYGLLISLTAKLWGTGGLVAPKIFPDGHLNVGDSQLQYGQIGLIAFAIVVTLLLQRLFRGTWFGLSLRGAADNRRAASLIGVNPDRTTMAAWAMGGALAAASGILLAAVTSLNPYTLSLSVLPAFVAALLGGLESTSGAMVGSMIVGLVIGFVPLLSTLPVFRVVIGQVGGAELTLAITAMVVMALRGRKLVGSDVRGETAGTLARVPRPGPRRMGVALVALVGLVGWVWILPFSVLGDVNLALTYIIVGISLVLLTGWVGQISLAQATFVGIGAYSTTFVVLHLGLTFPYTIVVAAIVTAAMAALLGMVALRVRGLYLAVATLIFAWMADSYLFSSPWLTGAGGSISIPPQTLGAKGGIPFFDFGVRRTFYFVALAAAAGAVFVVSNLRRTKTGRAFFAIRGSEVAAASLGINVTRYKLLAFAISGAMAGVAGNLIATHQQTISPAGFSIPWSLFYLAVLVVGGVQSIGGIAISSVIFAFLYELFFRVSFLSGWLDVVSAGLLAMVLLFYPDGLAALSESVKRMRDRGRRSAEDSLGDESLAGNARWLTRTVTVIDAIAGRARWVGRELEAMTAEFRGAVRSVVRGFANYLRRAVGRVVRTGAFRARASQSSNGVHDVAMDATADGYALRARSRSTISREDRPTLLDAREITVQFGGLVACNNASLSIHDQEVVGLIGPNGAGKTTLFNAITGFVAPVSGAVRFRDEDVTKLPVHERARRGIGRTFQMIQLFPQLSVTENLLVATHTHDKTGTLSHMLAGRATLRAEAAAFDRVQSVLPTVGLEDLADEPVGSLPFGTLRLVELARAVVSGAPLVMLDEPASGLDSNETLAFGDLLKRLREELGLSILLIEHDVQLVMSICDYVYVLDGGSLIAQGVPQVVQSNPDVLAAYLGHPATPELSLTSK